MRSLLTNIIILIILTAIFLTINSFAELSLYEKTTTDSCGRVCMNARLSINSKDGYTCHNGSGILLLQVERGYEDFSLTGIVVIVNDPTNKQIKSFIINSTANPSVKLLSSLDFNASLKMPSINEGVIYLIKTGIDSPYDISIAPLVKVGKVQKVCDVSARVKLGLCNSSIYRRRSNTIDIESIFRE